VLSYGIGIRPGLIVGFDSDGSTSSTPCTTSSRRLPPPDHREHAQGPDGHPAVDPQAPRRPDDHWTKAAENSRLGLNRGTNIIPAA